MIRTNRHFWSPVLCLVADVSGISRIGLKKWYVCRRSFASNLWTTFQNSKSSKQKYVFWDCGFLSFLQSVQLGSESTLFRFGTDSSLIRNWFWFGLVRFGSDYDSIRNRFRFGSVRNHIRFGAEHISVRSIYFRLGWVRFGFWFDSSPNRFSFGSEPISAQFGSVQSCSVQSGMIWCRIWYFFFCWCWMQNGRNPTESQDYCGEVRP